MIPKVSLVRLRHALIATAMMMLIVRVSTAQEYRFSGYITPAISWFSTDITEVVNQGSRAGIIFVVSAERYFINNISATAGLSLINSGGRLVSSDPTIFKFSNYTSVVASGDPMVYRIQYLAIPAGFKFYTNEIGYNNLIAFGEIGIDPKVVVRGRVDIPSLDIEGEGAMAEINRFNFGWHLHAGIEYPLGGSTAAVLGLGFENNFPDITRDVGTQANDRVAHKFLKFIFGVKF